MGFFEFDHIVICFIFQKCHELEKEVFEKNEKLIEVEESFAICKEEFENYKRFHEGKLNAYEKILEM